MLLKLFDSSEDPMVQLFVKGVIFSFSFAVEKHFLIYAAFNKKR